MPYQLIGSWGSGSSISIISEHMNWLFLVSGECHGTHRGYPAKRALSAMRKHGGRAFFAGYPRHLICQHCFTLHWRHNDHDGVLNHQSHGCLLNRVFRRRSKETSKLRVTGLCVGNSPGPVNSPHKGPVTRKMFPFGDVIKRLRLDALS